MTESPKNIPSPPKILLLQPFGKTFTDAHRLVEDACNYSKPPSELWMFDESVISGAKKEVMLEKIKTCDVIICDITDQTPNIVFAAGYATALHRDVILISQSSGRDRVGMKDEDILQYEPQFDPARSHVFSYTLAAEIDGRLRQHRDVFFGYCGRVDNLAVKIRAYLESSGLSVLDWARDFRVGRTILDEVTRAAARCRCGLFLFTADDPLEGLPTPVAIPRDNVILETGYFISAHGSERVVVVQEKGTKMPADLGGLIYLTMEDRDKWEPVAEKVAEALRLAIKGF